MENDPFPRLTKELQDAANNPSANKVSGVAIIGDIEPFVSSVDGSLITGRRSLREHNKRNGVVLAADLAGLPPMMTVNPHKPTQQERKELRDQIGRAVYKLLK